MTDGDPQQPSLVAVDLGSNSFHMLITRLQGDEPVTVDRIRDQVQLAQGLTEDRDIAPEAWERGLDCLRRFGQRLRDVGPVRVRAVGTNTLRVARNAAEFCSAAREALGYRIDVISGQEEARLIYLGLAHVLSDDSASRLVIDIGGGSTECIVGKRFEAVTIHSYYMGCVNFSQRFFPDGKLSNRRMTNAVLAAQLELHANVREFRDSGWTEAAGASGTVKAVAAIAKAAGWCEEGITAKALRQLRKEIVAAGHVDKLTLPGLKASRTSVIAGGVAILQAAFDSLNIEQMTIASSALQEGVLYDLLGRIQHEDVRVRTIRVFQERYHVDRAQAERVEQTALELLERVAGAWGLDGETEGERARRYLSWSSRLHEIGLTIAYNHHHRHGAYLIENGEMQGFSNEEQLFLAVLVGAHRRRVKVEALQPLRSSRRRLATQLIVLLRVAVLLNRGRSPERQLLPQVEAEAGSLTLLMTRSWMEANPLAIVDLAGENKDLRGLDVRVQAEPLPTPDEARSQTEG